MDIQTILTILLIIDSIFLTVIILFQKNRDAGFGMTNENQKNSYWAKNKKHSLEGRILLLTRFSAVLFFLLSGILMMIK